MEEDTAKWKISLWQEEGDNNMGCYMQLNDQEFLWHEGSEEDKATFRNMLNGFSELFNRC